MNNVVPHSGRELLIIFNQTFYCMADNFTQLLFLYCKCIIKINMAVTFAKQKKILYYRI